MNIFLFLILIYIYVSVYKTFTSFSLMIKKIFLLKPPLWKELNFKESESTKVALRCSPENIAI